MTTINLSSDIIPLGEFKARLSGYFKRLRSGGHPLVITQNGKPAGVLISPAEYDELVYNSRFLTSVRRGITDVESGNVFSSDELRAELQKRRTERNLR